MTTATHLDVKALRTGHEQHDADLLTSLYAETAETTIVDQNNPPSGPRTLRGKGQIAELWQDIMGRGMTHEVERVIEGDDALAYRVACRYPDGMRVLALSMCELEDGKIAREVFIQAWDS